MKGRRALDVYDSFSVDETADYEKFNDSLLKNFDMTKRGFTKKFRYERPEKSGTFIQFSSRLKSYLNTWLKVEKIEESHEAVCDISLEISFRSHVIGHYMFILKSRQENPQKLTKITKEPKQKSRLVTASNKNYWGA